jgi:hypothetical protein
VRLPGQSPRKLSEWLQTLSAPYGSLEIAPRTFRRRIDPDAVGNPTPFTTEVVGVVDESIARLSRRTVSSRSRLNITPLKGNRERNPLRPGQI